MGRSISGFVADRSAGKFGPFENQLIIGDYTLNVIMQATMEQVNGVWQGACYPFREGLSTGILNLQFTPRGQLISGGTNRGWPVRGTKSNVLERVDWTGKVPFEIKEITARPKGFRLAFTNVANARDVANYRIETYPHIYPQVYGSPEVDHTYPKVTAARISTDGKTVDLTLDAMKQGHAHDFDPTSMKDAERHSLLHRKAYYTLERDTETVVLKKQHSHLRQTVLPLRSQSWQILGDQYGDAYSSGALFL